MATKTPNQKTDAKSTTKRPAKKATKKATAKTAAKAAPKTDVPARKKETREKDVAAGTHVPVLKQKYVGFREDLRKELGLKNIMQVPKLEKIVVNIGKGEAAQNIKLLDSSLNEIACITGQKAVVRRAKKSIAGFKIREKMPIGCAVTLRRERMYEFLYRLINIAVPRIRDFRGYSVKSFDGRGNYSLGISEQIIFPEIDYDKVDKISGLSVTIVTTATDDVAARSLLKRFNFPFKRTSA